MTKGFSRAECRALDRTAMDKAGIPGVLLMEHASLGTAIWAREILDELAIDTPTVWVLCGPGNNGGDGYAIARHLHNAEVNVHVWELVEPVEIAGDAAINRNICARMALPLVSAHDEVPEADPPVVDLIVDAIFGTGLSRPATGHFADAIERINASPAPVLAVDIPSGLDADSGEPLGATVKARWTATYGLLKQGFCRAHGATFTGEVRCVPIGVPRCFLPPGVPAFPPWAFA